MALTNGLEEKFEAFSDDELRGLTDDFREGVAAFLEKRPAKFKGS